MHSCTGRIFILDVGNKGGKKLYLYQRPSLDKGRLICFLACSHHPGF